MPAAQLHRDELAAEAAKQRAGEKQISDCAEQARLAGEDMGRHSSVLGPPSRVAGVSNHYNRKLSKCIVDVQTAQTDGVTETLMDAYEQSYLLYCFTTTKLGRCVDALSNTSIDPAEADKRIDALLRE